MTTVKKQAVCHSCGKPCEDFKELAQHIATTKDKAHRKGKKWAANYLLQTRRLNQKRDPSQRPTLTPEQKEAKQNMYRELSGGTQRVRTCCPKCKRPGSESLPVEYTGSATAWRVAGRFAYLCESCR